MYDNNDNQVTRKVSKWNMKRIGLGILAIATTIGAYKACEDKLPDIGDVVSAVTEITFNGNKIVFKNAGELAKEISSMCTEINIFDFEELSDGLPIDISTEELIFALNQVKVTITDT
jgi:hypothetical protein